MSDEFDMSLMGLYAVNGGGAIGRIEGIQVERGLRDFIGKDLRGRPWKAACPHILCEVDQQLLREHFLHVIAEAS